MSANNSDKIKNFVSKMLLKYSYMLKKSNVIISTLSSDGNLMKPKLDLLLQVLGQFSLLEHLTEIQSLDNNNLILISFKNEIACKRFRNSVSEIAGLKIIFVEQNIDSNYILINIFWTPYEIVLRDIQNILLTYGTIVSVTPTIKYLNGQFKFFTSPIKIMLDLKQDYAIDDIPHVIMNQFGVRTWLSVQGAVNNCFKCLNPGHISRFCTESLCTNCQYYKPKDHSCSEKQWIYTYNLTQEPYLNIVNSSMIKHSDNLDNFAFQSINKSIISSNLPVHEFDEPFTSEDEMVSVPYASCYPLPSSFDAIHDGSHSEDSYDLEQIRRLLAENYNIPLIDEEKSLVVTELKDQPRKRKKVKKKK